MKITVLVCLMALCVSGSAMAGVLVSPPSNLNDYIAVQFVPGEDNPTIKANGLTTTNGYVWVEKSSPTFETEFIGYDYPFALHNLSAFTSLNSGVIETGFGNEMREVKYFSNDWAFFPWSVNSQALGVPEPSTLGMASVALLVMFRRKR